MDSMRNYKVAKAMFQLIVILLASFSYFAFSSESVSAASENTVCCEQTVNNGYCEYVLESECKHGSKMAPTSCELTSYCKPGCFIDIAGEGYCYSNYPKAKAELSSGKFDANPTCDNVPECKKGCCIIGTQAAYVTENRCKKETEGFKYLEMDFRAASSEEECLKIAHTADKGACVSEEGSCVYTTNAECNIPRAEISNETNSSKASYSGFYKGKYCSEVSDCTAGEKSKRTGCLPNSDDVYYFDSCGNPENIAYPCNYAEGAMCGDKDGDGNYECEKLDCGSAKDMLGSQFTAEPDYTEVQKNEIKHGESWCLYDYNIDEVKGSGENNTAVNKLTDVADNLKDLTYSSREPVGSRHYRAICINGKQFIEPCEDYRKEWCLQGYVDTSSSEGKSLLGQEQYTEARCIDNRWQSCIDDCNSAKPDMSETEWNDAQKKDAECCVDISKRDCVWVGGKCVPRVKPGTKFWENEGSNNCGKASLSCSFALSCDGWDRLFTWGSCNPSGLTESLGQTLDVILGWNYQGTGNTGWRSVDSKQTDRCLSEEFIQASNNLCRSYGDCGASYNLEGIFSYSGFSSPSDLGGEYSSIVGDKLKNNQLGNSKKPDWSKGFSILDFRLKGREGDMSDEWSWEGWAGAGHIANDIIAPLTFVSIAIANALDHYLWSGVFGKTFVQGTFSGFYSSGAKLGTTEISVLEQGVKDATAEYTKANKALKAATTDPKYIELVKNNNLAKKSMDEAKSSLDAANKASGGGWGTFMDAVNVYMWVKMVYDLVDTFASKQEVATVQTVCTNWQAPQTKDDCEKCNPGNYMKNGKPLSEDAFKACSEYRCKSYGASCDLINKGTGNETCVSQNQYDVNSPVIKPWKEGFSADYQDSIQEIGTGLGMKITKEIPIYEKVLLAIKTDEPSQCKMSFNHTQSYNVTDPVYFGGTNYDYYHVQTIFYPSSKNYTKEGVSLTSGGNYSLYLRCTDAVGNANAAEYAVQFSIGKEPDLTAPIIEGSSIANVTYVTAGQNDSDVTLYINEPAICRWSNTPLSFNDMDKNKECTTLMTPNSLTGYYDCDFSGNKKISGIGGGIQALKYAYFKCQDKSKNKNTNKDPYAITFKGSQPLNITSLTVKSESAELNANNELFVDLTKENITLEVVTAGGASGNGDSTCKYTSQDSLKKSIGSMDDILDSYGAVHKKLLTGLSTGAQNFYIGCSDVAGNVAFNQIGFKLLTDTSAPSIVKYYWDEETLGHLVFFTSELANCEYSMTNPGFKLGEGSATIKDGTRHDTAENSAVYYVICTDSFSNSNAQPYVFRRL